MCFVCFGFCLLCSKLELVGHCLWEKQHNDNSLNQKFGNSMPEAPLQRFKFFGVNLGIVQRIQKELNESNGEYEGTATQKLLW